MPRYYFDVQSGNEWTVDASGEVFADDEAANEAALDIIYSVTRDERRRTGSQHFVIRVRDEVKRFKFEASFRLKFEF